MSDLNTTAASTLWGENYGGKTAYVDQPAINGTYNT